MVDLTLKEFINLVPSAATGWLVAYFTTKYFMKSNEERIAELKEFYEGQNIACEKRCTQLQQDITDLYKKLLEMQP